MWRLSLNSTATAPQPKMPPRHLLIRGGITASSLCAFPFAAPTQAIIMHVESTTSPPTTKTAEISFPDLVEEEHVTVHTWTEGA